MNHSPKIKYIIAGEGPEKKSLLKLTTKLNINDFVLFIDNVDNEGKKEIFEKSTLMVMPTSNESFNRSIEGFGIVFIEAALFGITSIATNVGGTSDAIIDEKTGYRDFFNDKEMVFYKNISDLSEKIMKISKDEKLRKLIAKKGRDKYHKYFNSNIVSEFIVNKTLEINHNKNKYLWHRP